MYETLVTIQVKCDVPGCGMEERATADDQHDAREDLEASGWLLDGDDGLPEGSGSYVNDEDVAYLDDLLLIEQADRSLCWTCLEEWCEEKLRARKQGDSGSSR